MSLEIRKLKPEDFNDVKKIIQSLWFEHAENSNIVSLEKLKDFDIQKYLEEVLNDEKQIFLVATSNNEIIGTIRGVIENNEIWMREEKRLYLDELFIKEKFRIQGVASSLLEKCIEFAKKNNINEITSKIYDFNTSSKNLFEKYQFNPEYAFYYLNLTKRHK